eukprot:scaffold59610_cov26-Tisochrysis_lutea.AAC.1
MVIIECMASSRNSHKYPFRGNNCSAPCKQPLEHGRVLPFCAAATRAPLAKHAPKPNSSCTAVQQTAHVLLYNKCTAVQLTTHVLLYSKQLMYCSTTN